MAETPKNHRQKELLAYAQNFLDDDQRRELEGHLAGCADCKQTLEEVRRFLPALQQALTPKEMPTEEMWAKAQAQFRNRPPPKESFFTRMRVGLMVGGAALATAVLIVAQPLLHRTEAAGIAAGDHADAGEPGGVLTSPRRPEPVDAGPDAGVDAGIGVDGHNQR